MTEGHMGLVEIILRLGLVLALILANAFFVAAEFALVAVRRSRIDEMVHEGDGAAKAVQKALTHLDRYISGTQLGITLASLGLGYVGEATLAGMADRALIKVGLETPLALNATHTGIALTIAFAIITFLHVVIGELAPKSLALVHPEGVSRAVVRPLVFFSLVMRPIIVVLNGAAAWGLRLVGLSTVSEHSQVHSPEELRLLVMQARASGTIDESDSAMLAGVFDFHHKRARDVMRPRTEIVALPIDASEDELYAIIRKERYSRYPVYRESLDDLVGVFLAKDLWLRDENEPFNLAALTREAMYVPDTRPAERVLDDLRRTRKQMAVVLDEYGGTAGILTLEDLVEEVIGDIADEYDGAARSAMVTDGVLELEGTISLLDVRSDHQIRIPEGDWTTIGGFVFAELGRLPKMGDRVAFPGGQLEVVAMNGRRVAAVRVHRNAKERS
jgi:CBS domain containing-hemolysin-like protein